MRYPILADATSQAICFLAGVRTPAGAKSVFETTGLIVTQTGPHQREPDGIVYDITRSRKGALIFLVFVARGGGHESLPHHGRYIQRAQGFLGVSLVRSNTSREAVECLVNLRDTRITRILDLLGGSSNSKRRKKSSSSKSSSSSSSSSSRVAN